MVCLRSGASGVYRTKKWTDLEIRHFTPTFHPRVDQQAGHPMSIISHP